MAASRQTAKRCFLLDREDDQLDRTAEVDGAVASWGRALSRTGLSSGRYGSSPIHWRYAAEILRAHRACRDQHLGGGHVVFPAIRPAARRGHGAPLVSIVVELHHRDRLADHEAGARQRNVFLQCLLEVPDSLVIAACSAVSSSMISSRDAGSNRFAFLMDCLPRVARPNAPWRAPERKPDPCVSHRPPRPEIRL